MKFAKKIRGIYIEAISKLFLSAIKDLLPARQPLTAALAVVDGCTNHF